MKDLFSKCYEYQRQDSMRENNTYPYFRSLDSGQGPVVIMEGKRKLMFGSNSYLGLTSSPDLVDAAVKAVRELGCGTAGSRFLNGSMKLHAELEEELSGFLKKDGCIVFPSGYQTNLGIISGVAGMADYVIIDRESHASIYDGCKLSGAKVLRFFHNDVEDLEKKLASVPDNFGCLVVVDGIYSMSGDIADLPGICKAVKKFGARLMVDDSHALGILGEGGRGTASYFGLEEQVDILMGTLSKAVGALGGYMAADARVIDYVRNSTRPFMFSTSNSPADTAAALAGIRHIKAHPDEGKKVLELAQLFREELKKRNLKIKEAETPIVPIYTYDSQRTLRCCCRIFDEGVYVNSVLTPAVPEGQCMLRTSVMATHTPEQIREAAESIARVVLDEEAKAAK